MEPTIAIYARASGTHADHSLIAQVDGCRRVAESLCCVKAETFIDTDTAGQVRGVALGQLLKACAKGRFDAMVTESRDRLTRDPARLDSILALMTESGVAVHFACEGSGIVTDPI